MAITNQPFNPELDLHPRWRSVCGLASTLLGLLGLGGLLTLLLTSTDLDGGGLLLVVMWLIVLPAITVTGAMTLRNNRKAVFVLLAVWLAPATATGLLAFAWLIQGVGPWGLTGPGALFGVVVGLAVASGMTALCILTIPPRTHARYGANVATSAAAALLVVVVVNFLAFRAPVTHDFETLGRYGLSDRTKRILAKLDQPVTLSAIYTATAQPAITENARRKKEHAEKYLRRVMDFFGELERAGKNISTADASGEAARALLLARLRDRQQARTGQHEVLLSDLRTQLPAVLTAIENSQAAWRDIPEQSYLAQWDFGGELVRILERSAKTLRTVDQDITQELQSNPLPDHVALLGKLTDELSALRTTLTQTTEALRAVGTIPALTVENAPAATRAMQTAQETVSSLPGLLGEQPAKDIADPKAMLETVSEAIGRAVEEINQASRALQTLTGENDKAMQYVEISDAWQTLVATQLGNLRLPLDQSVGMLAESLGELRSGIQVNLRNANDDALRRMIGQLREVLPQYRNKLQATADDVTAAVQALQTVDEFSRNRLAMVEQDGPFAALRTVLDESVQPLLAKADALPEPDEARALPDLTGENILVLEAANTVEVIPFEDVWPTEFNMMAPPEEQVEPRRFFNGDAAVASRLLGLVTDKPFARILLTHYAPPQPRQQNPFMPQPPQSEIPVQALTTLRAQLQDANVQVEEWNLIEDFPVSDADTQADNPVDTQPSRAEDEIPTILMILPPPPPMPLAMPNQPAPPSFGPAEIAKINNAVNQRGCRAIFLLKSLLPMPMGFGQMMPQQYPLNTTLQQDWGINPMTRRFLVQGVPAEENPGLFRVVVQKLYYMPLSNFTDHPIGNPLRGQFLVWPWICPLRLPSAGQAPEHVTVWPLLTVPGERRDIWAESDLEQFAQRVQNAPGNLIAPDPENGALLPPLTVAAAAERTGAPNAADTRIVVLGVAGGLLDGYLDTPIPRQTEGFAMQDAPRGNADLVVNSALWLSDHTEYIAAGPARIEPVRPMDASTVNLLWTLVVVVLPTAVLLIGGAVLLERKRS
jgi:hypothetical protein